jgi:hypothetical protein
VAGAAVLSAGLLLSACGGDSVHVDRFTVSAAGHETCQRLLSALPDRVAEQRRRTVTGSTYAAAWGDPAIVLRCGVAMPKTFDKFSTCQETNGIGWFIPEEQMTGEPTSVTMTTIGRDVNVEVTLPREHWPPANAMVDLARAIKKTTAETAPCL